MATPRLCLNCDRVHDPLRPCPPKLKGGEAHKIVARRSADLGSNTAKPLTADVPAGAETEKAKLLAETEERLGRESAQRILDGPGVLRLTKAGQAAWRMLGEKDRHGVLTGAFFMRLIERREATRKAMKEYRKRKAHGK